MGRTSLINTENQTTIRHLAAEGLTTREIATQTGLPRQVVYNFLRRKGIPFNKRYQHARLREEDKRQIRELARLGLSAKEIADKIGCTDRTVFNYVWRVGIRLRRQDRKFLYDVIAKAQELINTGMTRAQAAAELGLNLSSLDSAFSVYGRPWEAQQPGTVHTGRRKDPRSAVCRQIDLCSHRRCHLHQRCPAFRAWEERQIQSL